MLAAFSFAELLQGFGILCIVVFVVIVLIKKLHLARNVDGEKQDSVEFSRVAFKIVGVAFQAVGISVFILTVLDLTNAWRVLWRPNGVLDLNGVVFPDLNGRWEGLLLSNGPLQDAPSNPQQMPKPDCSAFGEPGVERFGCDHVTVNISMGLFATDVQLNLGKSVSHSKGLSLKRRHQQRNAQLMYFFEAVALDGLHFNGAAVLDAEVKNEVVLQGGYWTDRNWRAGKNTAGLVRLTRVNQ